MERIPVDTSNIFRLRGIYTAFRRKFHCNYYYAGEAHDLWELVIVLHGKIGVTAGANVYTLSEGQAILHEPMEFHRLWSEGDTAPEAIIFTFYADCIPQYSTRIYHDVNLSAVENILSALREAFETDRYCLIRLKDAYAVQAQIALKTLEVFMLKTLTQAAEASAPRSRSAQNYETIVRVLESNLDKNLSVGEIAQMCNMGEVNVKQTFSRYAGMGVMQYFNRIKVTRAAAMLQKGSTVQEVAAALGFASQNYFSTVFKRITGKSPSAYKAER